MFVGGTKMGILDANWVKRDTMRFVAWGLGGWSAWVDHEGLLVIVWMIVALMKCKT